MRDRLIAAAVLLASIACIPVAIASNAHARTQQQEAPGAYVTVLVPECAAAEDACAAEYHADGTWRIVPFAD